MDLSTADKFLLLAQHPDKGRFILSQLYLRYGLIGAVLLELSLEHKIVIENNRLIIKNGERTNHPVITDIMTQIGNSSKPRKIKYWITKFAQRSGKYKWHFLNMLADKGLIRIENRKFLGFIPYKKTYLVNSKIRIDLILELKNNVLFRRTISEEDIVILGLIEACKMHKVITRERDELKKLKKELKEVLKENPIADTVDKTIKQMQAAITTAIIASTAASAGSR